MEYIKKARVKAMRCPLLRHDPLLLQNNVKALNTLRQFTISTDMYCDVFVTIVFFKLSPTDSFVTAVQGRYQTLAR